MNKPTWSGISANFSGSNQAMQNAQRGFNTMGEASQGILDTIQKEEMLKQQQANKEIEQQRLADALALQQQEAKNSAAYREGRLANAAKTADLAEKKFYSDEVAKGIGDYSAGVVARLAQVPVEQRPALLKEIQTKEGGFAPQGQTLSNFIGLMTPTTVKQTPSDKQAAANADVLMAYYPKLSQEEALVLGSSPLAIDQFKKKQEDTKKKTETNATLNKIRKAWEGKLPNAVVKDTIDTFGEKAGYELAKELKASAKLLSEIRTALDIAINPGPVTGGLDLEDLPGKVGGNTPLATREGLLDLSRKNPKFAASLKEILTDPNLEEDTWIGTSKEDRLADLIKEYK